MKAVPGRARPGGGEGERKEKQGGGVSGARLIGVRGPREDFATITKKGLIINPFATNIKDEVPTSTLFYRQQHLAFDAKVTVKYTPKSEKELAGIVCYQKE